MSSGDDLRFGRGFDALVSGATFFVQLGRRRLGQRRGPRRARAGLSAGAAPRKKDVMHPSFQVHCDSCGMLHRNPRLCDTYRTCDFCFKIHRQPDQLRVTHRVRPKGPLHIQAAAYGHRRRRTARSRRIGSAAEVCEHQRRRVRAAAAAGENLVEPLGDLMRPARGSRLRLRYAIQGRRAERLVTESEPGFLAQDVLVQAARGRQPRLVVRKATYGHPHGVIRGRGAFDVTEFLQARVDDGEETSCALALRRSSRTSLATPARASRKTCGRV